MRLFAIRSSLRGLDDMRSLALLPPAYCLSVRPRLVPHLLQHLKRREVQRLAQPVEIPGSRGSAQSPPLPVVDRGGVDADRCGERLARQTQIHTPGEDTVGEEAETDRAVAGAEAPESLVLVLPHLESPSAWLVDRSAPDSTRATQSSAANRKNIDRLRSACGKRRRAAAW